MTPSELKTMLAKVDADAERIGLSPSVGLPMVTMRKNCPRGDSIKTPFGLCKIMNTQMKDGLVQVVFYAPRAAIEKYIKQSEAA